MTPRPSWITLPEILGTTAEATLADHPVAVIHFGAAWNSHDITMSHRLLTIRDHFAGRVALFACDIAREENAAWCHQLGINNVPTLVIFRGGIPGPPLVGLRVADTLIDRIEGRPIEPPPPRPRPATWLERLARWWFARRLPR